MLITLGVLPESRALPLLALLGVCLREAFSECLCVGGHQQGQGKHVFLPSLLIVSKMKVLLILWSVD